MSLVPFIITQDSTITMVLNNKPYTISVGHINYAEIVNELKKSDHDIEQLIILTDVVSTINNYIGETKGVEFDTDTGIIRYNGNEIHGTLVDRILTMYREGFEFEPMLKFLTNLYQNPSRRAIDELYSFIEYGKLPITDDGHFLAYKRVNEDYTSIHDGKTKNDIGTIVSMSRNQVDDNSNRTCSSGLHLCSYEYLQHFSGSRVVILKVNPKDIVSIPADYNNTKARACAYEIVGEVTPEELTNKQADNTPILEKNVIHLPKENVVEEITENVVEEITDHSEFFKAAYNYGYEEGYKKLIFTEDEIKSGEYLHVADNKTIILTVAEAKDINIGYVQGYKHGRGHKKRLLSESKFCYRDITTRINKDE